MEEIYKKFLNHKTIVINVGGQRFEILWRKIEALPDTRLAQIRTAKSLEHLKSFCDYIDIDSNEIFFDRDPTCFRSVVNFYRTGKLHLMESVCCLAFNEELTYWGIEDFCMEPCCFFKYTQLKETGLEEVRKEEKMSKESSIEENFIYCFPKVRKKIWQLMENQKSSIFSYILSFLSVSFVLLSCLILILETMPEFQIKTNITSNRTDEQLVVTENPILGHIESVCIYWFTFEYLTRLFASPDKFKFFITPLNIIDVVSILPYYILLFFDGKYKNLSNARRVITLFRILRLIRIFKLARHSTGLKTLGLTFKRSFKELGLLMMFMSVAVVIFSSLAYFAEKDQPDTLFESIPATFWWALITMTTVGYGDMIPTTLIGKLVGAVCCVSGVLVISLPIPIIVNNFAAFYDDQMRRKKSDDIKNLRARKVTDENQSLLTKV